jgi:hypothetical protein
MELQYQYLRAALVCNKAMISQWSFAWRAADELMAYSILP